MKNNTFKLELWWPHDKSHWYYVDEDTVGVSLILNNMQPTLEAHNSNMVLCGIWGRYQ